MKSIHIELSRGTSLKRKHPLMLLSTSLSFIMKVLSWNHIRIYYSLSCEELYFYVHFLSILSFLLCLVYSYHILLLKYPILGHPSLSFIVTSSLIMLFSYKTEPSYLSCFHIDTREPSSLTVPSSSYGG